MKLCTAFLFNLIARIFFRLLHKFIDMIDEMLKARAQTFSQELYTLLYELDYLDPIAGKNKIDAFVTELIKELHWFRINGKLAAFQNKRYGYLFGRMNKKNQIRKRMINLIRTYLRDRRIIVNGRA